MPIIGITGGIASGKSSFRKLLLERSPAEFFDADACAGELLNEDAAVRQQVLSQIHPEAYDKKQRPNRALLREIVYRDSSKKHALEAILHPLVREQWIRLAKDASARGVLFIVDIPLLFETRAEALFDHILLVACSMENQLARLMKYRNLERETAENIIASQLPQNIKIAKSHHVVWNDGPIGALTEQADLFSNYLNARYG